MAENDLKPSMKVALWYWCLFTMPVEFAFGFLIGGWALAPNLGLPAYLPWWLVGVMVGGVLAATDPPFFNYLMAPMFRQSGALSVDVRQEGLSIELPSLKGVSNPKARQVSIPYEDIVAVKVSADFRLPNVTYSKGGAAVQGTEQRSTFVFLSPENAKAVDLAWQVWKKAKSMPTTTLPS